MEELNITHMELEEREDFSELYILINTDKPQAADSYLVDDDHDFYLRVEPETEKIVGAFALFAADWFKEIAAAFEKGDLNHPDVRFFLQQKVNEMASRLPEEMENARLESPSTSTQPALDLAQRGEA